MKIDNFDLIRPHLTFENAVKFDSESGTLKKINDTYDRYIIHVLKRAKDVEGKKHGVNTSNRLIKTYEISSLEYFDKKRQQIIDLCEANKARAYIMPQVRSTYDCLKAMIKLGVDNLENPTVKFQHILRSSLCSMHKSRNKMWIIDLDKDCMTEYINSRNTSDVEKKEWTVEKVLNLVKSELKAIGKDPELAYVVPTKSGHHIVTPPFNLQSAYKKCNMLFEGEQKMKVGIRYTGPGESVDILNNIIGWLHKDGMTLLYLNF